VAYFVGRNAYAIRANFREISVQLGIGNLHDMVADSVGTLTVLAVAQVGSLFSADAGIT